MAVNTKIGAVDVSSASYAAKTTVVGQADVPGLSAQEMQKSVEYMPRNLLAPKINELVNAVNASYSKAEADAAINAKVTEIGTGDMAKAVYDASGTVQAAGGIAGYVSGQVSPVTKRVTTLENMKAVFLYVSADKWSSTAPYTATVTVSGMTADWIPGAPVLLPAKDNSGTIDMSMVPGYMREFAKVNMVTSGKDSITFTALEEKPTWGFRVYIPGLVKK